MSGRSLAFGVIARIQDGDREIRVELVDGGNLIDIRDYPAGGGETSPFCRNGIVVPAECLDMLIAALNAARAMRRR